MLKKRLAIVVSAAALGVGGVAAPAAMAPVEYAPSSISAVAASYTVTVKCQLVRFDPPPATAIGYITGTGSGPNYQTALNNAKRNADTKVPQGHYKRHCYAQN